MTKKRRHSRHEQDRAAAIAAPEQPAPPQSKRAASPYMYAAVLVALQLLVATIVLWQFLSGKAYFAYSDIGSDTHDHYIPQAMCLARELQSGLPSSWSFEVGLGTVTRLGLNPFLLLNAALGPDAVPSMRVWVYLTKLVAGGLVMYWFLVLRGRKPASSAVAALCYSYCGFMVVDGQWDVLATEYVMYPMLLLGLAYLRTPRRQLWPLPVAVALSVYSSVFLFSMCIFMLLCLAAEMIASDRRGAVARTWLTLVAPLFVLGLMLSAPQVIVHIAQLLDSPRVTGINAGFTNRLIESLGLNDARLVHAQIAGLFQKDLLGVGNAYRGWMNYLEGPTYFVGLLPLMAIPQLWRGSPADRRILTATLIAIVAIVVLPASRYLAFGFALPYFRVNNLWVSLTLLAVTARAIDRVIERGVSRATLSLTISIVVGLLLFASVRFPRLTNQSHVTAVLALTAVSTTAMLVVSTGRLRQRMVGPLFLAVCAVTSVTLSYAPFNSGRTVVTSRTLGFDDATGAALQLIRSRDPGVYRIEKSYDSVSFCDSVAQGYMGVKSYWFHGSSVVRLYSALDLFPKRLRQLNFTNWLPNFGARFALYSLFGVKYFISRVPLDWPGFEEIGRVDGLRIYENSEALPLGVVYTRQMPVDVFESLPPESREAALLRAAVVQQPIKGIPITTALDSSDPSQHSRQSTYSEDLLALKRRSLLLNSFSNTSLSGTLTTDEAGVLVLSIPYSLGWAITIDGKMSPPLIANMGMLATEIAPGPHHITVSYTPVGQSIGIALACTAAAALTAMSLWTGRLASRSITVPVHS